MNDNFKQMKQFRIFGLLVAVLLMGSCDKGEDEATGTGDAIIVAKQSGGSIVYGLSLYAYTYSAFSAVNAVSPGDGETYTLQSNEGFKTSFSYETPENAFTSSPPAAGTYQFSASFENGVNKEFQNTLTDVVLPIPVIEKCAYSDEFHQLELEWALLNGASSYAVNILEGTQIVFRSLELKNVSQGAFLVQTTGGGWDVGFIPESGKAYTVRLFAYMYEPNGGAFNIQAISIADRTVVWGN